MTNEPRKRVVILGAGGRDFHNFNRVFRNDPSSRVVAFTATQIPGIENRRYPRELAGPHYPEGIPIIPESALERLIREERVQEVVFSYSDVSHEQLMRIGSRINALGPDFRLLGTQSTAIESQKPVIAVVASRTGC